MRWKLPEEIFVLPTREQVEMIPARGTCQKCRKDFRIGSERCSCGRKD